MKGTNLGEFEELVMLTVGILHPNAYGVGIKQEILNQTKRNFGESTGIRGGKRKKYFTITAYGARCLREAQEIRQSMYQTIPSFVLDQA